VDGGLSSNLPAFLFHNEYRKTGFPVFAFDLTAEETDPPEQYGLKDFVGDMMSTALDAGDELLREVVKEVIHVPVPIPDRFDVLNFRISASERGELFGIGYQETGRKLSTLEFLANIKKASDDLQKSLQARYGDPKLYEPVLASLARDIEKSTRAENVRAHLTLPTGRGTRIVVYSYGMITRRPDGKLSYSTDAALELAEAAGCTGAAFTQKGPFVADLEEASRDPTPWGMTHLTHDLVPKDRKAMLSVPIWSDSGEEDDLDRIPVGTLSVDSTTPLADTEWMDGKQLRTAVLTRITLWENVVRRLLRKRHP
jgi:NTE family protein